MKAKKHLREGLVLPPRRRVTGEWLRSLGACGEARTIFVRRWPRGVVLSQDALIAAADVKLDIDWLARSVLEPAGQVLYQQRTERHFRREIDKDEVSFYRYANGRITIQELERRLEQSHIDRLRAAARVLAGILGLK